MASSLASLVVDLQVNTAELRKGLDAANKQLHDFGEEAKKAFESFKAITGFEALEKIGEFALEAAEKVGEFVLAGAEAADKMGKLAAAAQVPVDTFQRLAYAAKLGGVSAEDLGASFNKLNKALGEAEQGSATQVALFQALGVNLKDSSGKARDSASVFKELAAKISDMAPGFAKADIEMQLFGKSGTALDTALKNVAGGMADAGGEADKFGLVLDEHAIKAATEFHDNVEKIKMAVDNAGSRIAGNLSPALSALTTEFLKSKDAAKGLDTIIGAVSDTIKGVITVVIGLHGALDAFAALAAGPGAAAMLLLQGNFKAAGEALTGGFSKAVAETSGRIRKIWFDDQKVWEDFQKSLSSGLTKVGEDPAEVLRRQKAAEEYVAALKKIEEEISKYKEKLSSLQGNNSPMAELEAKLSNGPLADAFKKLGKDAEKLKAILRDIVKETEKVKIQHVVDAARFQQGRSDRSDKLAQNQMRLDYESVGATPRETASFATAGFKDFDNAMTQLAESTKEHNQILADLKVAEEKKQTDLIQDLTIQADKQQVIIANAKKAAEGFKTLAEQDVEEAKAAMEHFMATLEGMVSHMLGKMGDLGQTIQAGIEGFKQGGIWGALIAVLIELFSKFKRFQEIIDFGDAQIGQILDELKGGFGEIVDGFKQIMTASGPLMHIITDMLSPVLRAIGHLLNMVGQILTPILAALETGMETVGPILDAFLDLLDAIDPLLIVVKLVSVVFNLLSELMLGIMIGLEYAWMAIASAIHDVLKALGTHSDWIDKSLVDTATGIANNKAQMDKIWGKNGEGILDPNANAKAPAVTGANNNLADSANKAATSLQKMNEQLTNVPQGFKIAAARYAATAAQTYAGANAAVPGAPSDPNNPWANQNPFDYQPPVSITVQGSVISEDNLMKLIDTYNGRQKFRKGGI